MSNNFTAEKTALAILLAEPSLSNGCGLKSSHFLNYHHRTIFNEIVIQANEPGADMTTVAAAISNEVGGVYVAELFSNYYWHNETTLNTHVKTIVDSYNRQKVKYIGSKMMEANGNPLTILAEAEEELSEFTKTTELFRSNKAILNGTMKTLEQRAQSIDGVIGERLRFKKLDSLLGGGHDGRFWILGGRPGQGKSALAGNIIERRAIHNNEPCCVFSLEMGDETWMERFLMSVADVTPSDKPNYYGFNERDYASMMDSTDRIMKAPVYIIEYGGMTIDDVCMSIKLMKKKHGVNFFIIDYIQQLSGSGTEYEIVTAASKKLAALKQKLKINILAVAQLNRESESGGKARKPGPADLRNSGQLEQDADAIIFVHRPKHYDRQSSEDDIISVPKNRHGKTGDIRAKFTGHVFKWKEI